MVKRRKWQGCILVKQKEKNVKRNSRRKRSRREDRVTRQTEERVDFREQAQERRKKGNIPGKAARRQGHLAGASPAPPCLGVVAVCCCSLSGWGRRRHARLGGLVAWVPGGHLSHTSHPWFIWIACLRAFLPCLLACAFQGNVDVWAAGICLRHIPRTLLLTLFTGENEWYLLTRRLASSAYLLKTFFTWCLYSPSHWHLSPFASSLFIHLFSFPSDL